MADMGVIVAIVTVILLITSVLPAVLIGYGSRYSGEIYCGPNMMKAQGLAETVGVSKWMIIHGAIGLFEITCLLMTFAMVALKMLPLMVVSVSLVVLASLFRLSWLVVGALILWRDCPNMQPKSVNDLMYATLILGFFGIFANLTSSRASQKK